MRFEYSKEKTYNTWCSQAVTLPSTNQAQCCLTSVIEREPVHSIWYGRRHLREWKRIYLQQYCIVVLYSYTGSL